jgi:hypothetical protein
MSHHVERPTDITVPEGSLWAKLPLIAGAIGGLSTIATVGMMLGHDGNRAKFSYLFAFMTVLSIALASLGFVLIQHATRAGWSAVVRRIAEASAATLPLFAVLFIPIAALGFGDLYPWSHESDSILEAKRWWLGAELGNHSMSKFLVRAVIFFGIWAVLGQLVWRKSLAMDKTEGDAQRTAITHSLWKLSAGGIFLFALSLAFAAVDWLMSLQPHWYSTMYGVYYFAGAMVGFYAFLALAMMALQKGGMLKHAITTEHYHDVGKFLFGHTVFWAYITFSQFMLIWYANMPEETEFFIVRMEGGWDKVSLAMPIIHFFLPFLFLISRHVKRHRVALAAAAVWMLAVHALDIFWNVMPNQGAHHGGPAGAAGEAVEAAAHHAPHFSIALTDITALVGVAGLFLAAFAFALKRAPVVCINEPRLLESLKHENY